MPTLFRRVQAQGRGQTRQRLTWEERASAALAAAREVEEMSGETVPTRTSEVNISRRLYYGPRYMLPGTEGDEAPRLQQREEPCSVLQGNMALRLSSLLVSSVVLEPSPSSDASVSASPYYTISFTVDTLVPLVIRLSWLATEEWIELKSTGASHFPEAVPRYPSRINLSSEYQLSAGLSRRFVLPRTDWLRPDSEPMRTLLSSDWQARNAVISESRTQNVVDHQPYCLSTAAAGGGSQEMIPMQEFGHQSGLKCMASEIQELTTTAGSPNEKAPAYGLIIELIDDSVKEKALPEYTRDRQISFIEFYRDSPAHTVARCVKQKIRIAGDLYQQFEIFGLSEARCGILAGGQQHGDAYDPLHCAICLSDERDTVLLPCRHLCMCRDCANTYRQQSNKCPICRTVVETILHIHSID